MQQQAQQDMLPGSHERLVLYVLFALSGGITGGVIGFLLGYWLRG